MPSNVANVVNDVWYRVRVKAKYCSAHANLKDLLDNLEKGEDYTNKAYWFFAISTNDQKSAEIFNKASDNIGKIKSGISSVRNVCIDVNAFAQISEALEKLTDLGVNVQGSEEAALAYGQLFEGVGHFASKLPAPFNAYGKILKECGILFLGVQRGVDPEKRSTQGVQLRQVRYDGT